MNEKYIQALRDTIRQKHGCTARYAQTIRIKEESEGQTLWEGNVELFDLAGHSKARQCYAWGHKDDAGHMQYELVLAPPIRSAGEAVRSFLARQVQKST